MYEILKSALVDNGPYKKIDKYLDVLNTTIKIYGYFDDAETIIEITKYDLATPTATKYVNDNFRGEEVPFSNQELKLLDQLGIEIDELHQEYMQQNLRDWFWED